MSTLTVTRVFAIFETAYQHSFMPFEQTLVPYSLCAETITLDNIPATWNITMTVHWNWPSLSDDIRSTFRTIKYCVLGLVLTHVALDLMDLYAAWRQLRDVREEGKERCRCPRRR